VSLFKVPKAVFVPFEWDGRKWVARQNLPRFREPEEAVHYLLTHPELSYEEGTGRPVYLQWQERNEQVFINEYLQGVGTHNRVKCQ
jgi:hypothetical protein